MSKKRPSPELLERYKANYQSDTDFAATARLLQCKWACEHKLQFAERSHIVNGQQVMLPPLWNFIDTAHGPSANAVFLNDRVNEVVRKVLDLNAKAEGKQSKMIKVDRLLGNLLSSQPLAFNLFAELSLDLDRATKVFQQVLGKPIDRVTSIEFEHSPGRGDVRFTGDHSAMDVFVEYTVGKKHGFVGIEVKYAEHLKDAPATYKQRYAEVAVTSGAFTPAGLEELKSMPKSIEQIWRDHLLCLSMVQVMKDKYDECTFMFLYPRLNTECTQAVARYSNLLTDRTTFKPVHMEDLVQAIADNGAAAFATQFTKRYLAFDELNAV
ncbi:MAG: hypothetical protein JNM62_05300 [Flavobacteriales bacterium]|nr:hypothetical protein [Flavobacteriales bacterium]